MGKRNDTSKSRPSRNRTASRARSKSILTKSAASSASLSNLSALEDTIEEERSRLMMAHSLLNCAAIAMAAEDVCNEDSPHYPSIVEMARDLVNQSINELDSVARNRVMKEEKLDADEEEFEDGPDPALHGKYMVKEPRPVYLS